MNLYTKLVRNFDWVSFKGTMVHAFPRIETREDPMMSMCGQVDARARYGKSSLVNGYAFWCQNCRRVATKRVEERTEG